jgi:hypothetical protein
MSNSNKFQLIRYQQNYFKNQTIYLINKFSKDNKSLKNKFIKKRYLRSVLPRKHK